MMRTNQNLMPALFDELMDWRRWNHLMSCEPQQGLPKMNISESDTDYLVELSIPGMNKEDLSLTVDADNSLIIQMQHKEEKKEENSSRKTIRKEFAVNSFKQTIALPENVKREQITAKVENGILMITLPKVTEEERKEKMQHIAIA